MIFATKTDTGLKRANNEDHLYSGIVHGWNLFIVADGMGGRNAGEVASKIAVESIVAYLQNHEKMEEPKCSVGEILGAAIKEANLRVHKMSMENEDYEGMGTTLSAVLIKGNVMVLGHVGDSRIYFFRDGKLEQITADHSYVAELVRTGAITKDEAKSHPKKNFIYRNLGYEDVVDVDIACKEFRIDDKLMLCSDGLSNQLEDEEILKIFIEESDPEASLKKMIQLVLDRGGFDNITAIVVHNVGGEA